MKVSTKNLASIFFGAIVVLLIVNVVMYITVITRINKTKFPNTIQALRSSSDVNEDLQDFIDDINFKIEEIRLDIKFSAPINTTKIEDEYDISNIKNINYSSFHNGFNIFDEDQTNKDLKLLDIDTIKLYITNELEDEDMIAEIEPRITILDGNEWWQMVFKLENGNVVKSDVFNNNLFSFKVDYNHLQRNILFPMSNDAMESNNYDKLISIAEVGKGIIDFHDSNGSERAITTNLNILPQGASTYFSVSTSRDITNNAFQLLNQANFTCTEIELENFIGTIRMFGSVPLLFETFVVDYTQNEFHVHINDKPEDELEFLPYKLSEDEDYVWIMEPDYRKKAFLKGIQIQIIHSDENNNMKTDIIHAYNNIPRPAPESSPAPESRSTTHVSNKLTFDSPRRIVAVHVQIDMNSFIPIEEDGKVEFRKLSDTSLANFCFVAEHLSASLAFRSQSQSVSS